MASRLLAQVFLPACLVICFGALLVSGPRASPRGAELDRAGDYEALREELRKELEAMRAAGRSHADRIEALKKRLRFAAEDLERARSERKKAQDENALIEAELEALRAAYREATKGG